MFTVNEKYFDKMLNDGLRWFDIVMYNYLKSREEIIGIRNDNKVIFDKETKTFSYYEDIKGVTIINQNIGKIFCVKGNYNTVNKEINTSLQRLEKRGYIKRISIDKDGRMTERKTRETRRVIIVKDIDDKEGE